jgi:MFS family permease
VYKELIISPGSFVPALLLDRVGRKYFLIVANVPRLVAALMMTFATEVWVIVAARALSGLSDMWIFTVVPMYASEVASVSI